MHRNSPYRAGRTALALVLSLCAGMALSTAQAATVTWTGNAGNGLWTDDNNWDASIPGIDDDVVFNSSALGQINLGGGVFSVRSLVLDGAEDIVFANGTLNLSVGLSQAGSGTFGVYLGIDVNAKGVQLGSNAKLRISNARLQVEDAFEVLGVPNQARLSIESGASVSAPSVNLIGARIEVDGSESRIEFAEGESQALAEILLTNGGVLGCIGADDSAAFLSRSGAFTSISLGNAGAPGRIDCDDFSFNQGVNATARINLFHNQNGYRIERPDGSPLSLNGSMTLTTGNSARTVLPGVHGFTGNTTLSNSATLELVGELTGSNVSLQTGTVLRGNGRVHGSVTAAANAVIAPGAFDNAQPGTLRFGSLNLVDQTQLRFDLSEPGTTGSPNDLVVVDGDASIDGGRVFIETLGDVGRYRLFNVGGTVTGGLVLQAVPAGFDLADWQIARSGGEIDLVPPATLEIDPATLALSAPEGGQSDGTVTLRNVGSSNLNVTQVDPPSNARFTRQVGTCGADDFVIPPGGSCTLIYRFASAQIGQFSSEILVRSFPQAAGATAFTLQGTATRLPPLLGPALISFGVVGVGETSAPQQASLFNPSSAALVIDDIDLGSGLAFGVTGTSCGASLASNTGCTVDVVFQPTVAGAASDTLRVFTEAGEASLDLEGEGFSLLIFRSGFED